MNLKIQIFNTETYKVWYTNKFGIHLPNQLVQVDHIDTTETDEGLNMQNVTEFKKKCIEKDLEKLQKFKEILQYGEHICQFCQDPIDYTKTISEYPLVALCYHDSCNHISHLSCMSTHIKKQQEENQEVETDSIALKKLTQRVKITDITKIPQSDLIPKKGSCPSCNNVLIWTTLVRYSTMVRLSLGYDGKEPIIEEEEEELNELEDTQDI